MQVPARALEQPVVHSCGAAQGSGFDGQRREQVGLVDCALVTSGDGVVSDAAALMCRLRYTSPLDRTSLCRLSRGLAFSKPWIAEPSGQADQIEQGTNLSRRRSTQRLHVKITVIRENSKSQRKSYERRTSHRSFDKVIGRVPHHHKKHLSTE
jgi:hypothetical protein